MPRIDYAMCTRPDFEPATRMGKLALEHAVDYLALRGMSLDDLVGDDAVRTKVLDSLSRNDAAFFFAVGHGRSDLFTGQDYDKIWWTCDCSQLRDRVVYLLSCICGAELVPDMVNDKGAWCAMGYSEVFGWIQERVQDPLADRYGRSFYEPVLELIYRLADGYTTGEAFRISLDKWNYWIDYWSRSPDPAAPLVLMWLIHDRDHQKLFGDEAAKVATAIPAPWWLLMGLGFAPVGAVITVISGEELRKFGAIPI